MERYAERRRLFAERLQGGTALIPAARQALRNADTEYEFRQNSDFFYLTGFPEPDAVLLITPSKGACRTILFVRPRDRDVEIWTGRRFGIEGACEQFGADDAYHIAELPTRLPELLVGTTNLFYDFGNDDALDRTVIAGVREARYRVRRGGRAPQQYTAPSTLLHEMRLFKSAAELDTMRRAAAITAAGFEKGMRATHPEMQEYVLEAIVEHEYRARGARDVAYPSIVAGGVNGTILHYHTNRDTLHDGDLVLVDSGCEFEHYASDVTRTWPVNGRFTAEQSALYEIVRMAQREAIEHIRPGESFRNYHNAAVRVITEGLVDLGLLSGNVESLIESGKFRDFYMHSTGHWLGLDVHDAGRYTNVDDGFRDLQPNMVLTVEPGIYVQPDLDCDPRFRGIGIRIEDDVLVTEGPPEILTAAIPRTIEEIEAIVGEAPRTS
jgi:Xaa-Pro aminopeptidase